MKHRSKYLNYSTLLIAIFLFAVGCKEEEYAVPTPKDVLQNDAIKRTLGPNLVGQQIEFAYAMGIIPEKGKLVSAEVEASIAGGTGTFLEHNFYTTVNSVDVPNPVGLPSVNSGAKSTVVFNDKIQAATLRYYYTIPEAARGKTVSFTFSAKSSNGETVSYNLGPYNISNMDMVRELTVSNNNAAYISIADMAIYNAADAQAKADKIDLVYLYRNLTTSQFNHALVSPAASSEYLDGVTLPTGVNRNTKVIKTFNLRESQLSLLASTSFIDDLDFEQINFSSAPNYALNLKEESGAWVETADGKYRAFIFVNKAYPGSTSPPGPAGTARISIKRYTMK